MVRMTARRVRLTRNVSRRAVGCRRTSTGAGMPSTLNKRTDGDDLALDRAMIFICPSIRRNRARLVSQPALAICKLPSHISSGLRNCLRHACGNAMRELSTFRVPSTTQVEINRAGNPIHNNFCCSRFCGTRVAAEGMTAHALVSLLR